MNGLPQEVTAHDACGKYDDDNKQRNQHAASICVEIEGTAYHARLPVGTTRIILGLIGLSCLCKTEHKSALSPGMTIAQVKALLFNRFIITDILKRIGVELPSHMAALRSHLLVCWSLRVM